MNAMFRRSIFVFLPLFHSVALATGCSGAPSPEDAVTSSSEALSLSPSSEGAVFTQTNAAGHNALVVYARAADGTLAPAGQLDTGGAGVGAGLSAQGAIARDGRWLFVVNAGSDDVSTFDLAASPPVLVARTPSGGAQPVSITARDRRVYVLNAGASGAIASFAVDARGALHALDTAPLSGADVTPTEVALSPDGATLVVTEKGTSMIDTYGVRADGSLEGPVVTASDGPAPFGFDFAPDGELFVSEAADSAASAYVLRRTTRLASISASVANGQRAACWLVASLDGRHVFTANAGNGTLSSYRVGIAGRLSLETGAAASLGAESHPIDMAFAGSGRYLVALANAAGTITVLRAEGGALAPIASVAGLPASATGLVAY